MKISRKHFQICKLFFDETSFVFDEDEYFMWGGIFLPIDCDLSLRLGKDRKEESFIHTLHYSKGISKKEGDIIGKFLKSFTESNSSFRSIVVKKSDWENLNNYKAQAKLAGLLISYPWIPYEEKIYINLSRARIIFDRKSMNDNQINRFKEKLNFILLNKTSLRGLKSKVIENASVGFSDKKLFDELQLVDSINGIIRAGYLLKNGEKISKTKKEIHDYFLSFFSEDESFIDISRNNTDQKVDVWKFVPKDN